MVGRCVATTPIETERTGEKRHLRKISRNVLCLILGFRVSTSAAQNAWHLLKGRKVTIMAEYIKREDAIKSFLDADTDIMADYGPDYGAEWGFSRDRVKEILDTLPSADVAEVVRCKDCIYHSGALPGQPNIICFQMKDNDFCSYGARMDKEAEHEAG